METDAKRYLITIENSLNENKIVKRFSPNEILCDVWMVVSMRLGRLLLFVIVFYGNEVILVGFYYFIITLR